MTTPSPRDFFPARRVTRPAADAATFAERIAFLAVSPDASAVAAPGEGTATVPGNTVPLPEAASTTARSGGAGNFAFLDAVTDWCAWWDDSEGEEAWT